MSSSDYPIVVSINLTGLVLKIASNGTNEIRSMGELVGRNICDVYQHKEDGMRAMSAALSTGLSEERNFLLDKNGNAFMANVSFYAFLNTDGEPQGFVWKMGSFGAPASGKKSELAAKLLERTTNMTWIRRADGAFINPEPCWEEATGQHWPSYSNFGWLEAHHPDDRESLATAFKEEAEKFTRFFRRVARIKSKDGTYRYTLIQAVPVIKHEKGRDVVTQWIGSDTDIHNLHVAESSEPGTWVWNMIGNEWKLDFHLFKDTSSLLEILHPDDLGIFHEQLQSALETDSGLDGEYRATTSTGAVYKIRCKGFIQKNTDGQPVAVLGVIWDTTLQTERQDERLRDIQKISAAEKKAEEAMRQKERLQDFVDTVCHEIRNPLNAIVGGVDLLEGDLSGLETETSQDHFLQKIKQLREVLGDLKQAAKQQKTIVDNVLDFSKLESDQMQLAAAPFNPRSLMENAAKIFFPQLVTKGLSLTVNIEEGDVWVKGDQHKLSIIVSNLLSNAIKFTSHGGVSIQVSNKSKHSKQGGKRLLEEEDSVEFEFCVEDTGIGMTDEELSKIFVPFAQANAEVSSQFGGSGLGLAISNKMIKLLGGEISVVSKKNLGSKFSFSLVFPVCSPPLETNLEPPAKRQRRLSSAEKNILIVEDNVLNQKILANYLHQRGCLCRLAQNGAEAVELSSQFDFDIILMDIEMPVMNGIEATRRIRETEKKHDLKRVPIVAMSGNARKEKIDEVIAAGVDAYLTKPYQKEEVYRVVDLHSR